MKVYRYMSWGEFNKMAAGLEIVGKRHYNANTTSTGICFLPETVTWSSFDGEGYIDYSQRAEECLNFLSGIVSDDVLVEFEADSTRLTETCGQYADPCICEWGAYISITEYCAPSYSRDSIRPLRYALVDAIRDTCDWYGFN